MTDPYDFEPDPRDRRREKIMIVLIGVFSGVFYYGLFRVGMALLGTF